jgi:hypothetical protein
MNNVRIDELSEEASEFVSFTLFEENEQSWEAARFADWKRKFAELIIRECMGRCSVDEHSPSYEARGRIAEHFGLNND